MKSPECRGTGRFGAGLFDLGYAYPKRRIIQQTDPVLYGTHPNPNVLETFGILNEEMLIMKWVSAIHLDMNKVKRLINQRLAHSFDDHLAQAVQLLNIVDQAKSKIEKLMRMEQMNISFTK
ncbi:unnamed protein product [Adineta ricciae]|uniref:Uncharacterized protein n=1 Tax=Adineta ricciae TaxID=249248 RepID=A0A815LVM3_ADIRI|nr:unnamed protein product [Adineta ricciae]CAF1414554.1 unnamed protein product [Adineta ricciae]